MFYRMDENLASGNTDKVKEILEMFVKDDDGVTFVSLCVPSVTFFTIDSLKADLETDDEDDDGTGRDLILDLIKDVEAKAPTDKLAVVLDKDLKAHKFTL